MRAAAVVGGVWKRRGRRGRRERPNILAKIPRDGWVCMCISLSQLLGFEEIDQIMGVVDDDGLSRRAL